MIDRLKNITHEFDRFNNNQNHKITIDSDEDVDEISNRYLLGYDDQEKIKRMGKIGDDNEDDDPEYIKRLSMARAKSHMSSNVMMRLYELKAKMKVKEDKNKIEDDSNKKFKFFNCDITNFVKEEDLVYKSKNVTRKQLNETVAEKRKNIKHNNQYDYSLKRNKTSENSTLKKLLINNVQTPFNLYKNKNKSAKIKNHYLDDKKINELQDRTFAKVAEEKINKEHDQIKRDKRTTLFLQNYKPTVNMMHDPKVRMTPQTPLTEIKTCKNFYKNTLKDTSKFYDMDSYGQSDVLFYLKRLDDIVKEKKLMGAINKTTKHHKIKNNSIRSQSVTPKVHKKKINIEFYDQHINKKCESELQDDFEQSYLTHFKKCNKQQIELFLNNFNRLERMVEIPDSVIDMPKMVAYWEHICSLNQDTEIDSEELLNNFNEWYLDNWRFVEANRFYAKSMKNMKENHLNKYVSPNIV